MRAREKWITISTPLAQCSFVDPSPLFRANSFFAAVRYPFCSKENIFLLYCQIFFNCHIFILRETFVRSPSQVILRDLPVKNHYYTCKWIIQIKCSNSLLLHVRVCVCVCVCVYIYIYVFTYVIFSNEEKERQVMGRIGRPWQCNRSLRTRWAVVYQGKLVIRLKITSIFPASTVQYARTDVRHS
jgi:hypothetical protein